MTPNSPTKLDYVSLLGDIKARIHAAQTRSVLAVNAEPVRLYWEVGQVLDQRHRAEGWGAGLIPRLARDLKNEFPEVKGFSERNIDRMVAFYREYQEDWSILPPLVAKMGKPGQNDPKAPSPTRVPVELLRAVPWAHHESELGQRTESSPNQSE